MPRGGVDPRFRRERTEEDPVFTYDDWERGFARFVAHKKIRSVSASQVSPGRVISDGKIGRSQEINLKINGSRKAS